MEDAVASVIVYPLVHTCGKHTIPTFEIVFDQRQSSSRAYFLQLNEPYRLLRDISPQICLSMISLWCIGD